MGYKYDVYIGYSRKDIDYARTILKALEKHGYTCFKNIDEVSHGDYSYDIIAESIDACRLFLFLSSESSNKLEWVLNEMAVALQKRKIILPVVIDDSTFEESLKIHLSNIISLNLHGKKKEVVAKCVLESVEGLLGKKMTYKYRLIRKLKTLFNSGTENNKDLISLYSPHKVDFDIFISYRRIDGRDVVRNIQQALKARGCKQIFFDYDSIQKGEFNKRIIDAIYSCTDFILVLSPKSMKRCIKDGDPVANEIRTAVKYNKNIIPVTIDGKEVKWPRSFPDDLQFIRGLQFHDHKSDSYFEHSIDELCEKLTCKES